jgi:hypothetical protein
MGAEQGTAGFGLAGLPQAGLGSAGLPHLGSDAAGLPRAPASASTDRPTADGAPSYSFYDRPPSFTVVF